MRFDLTKILPHFHSTLLTTIVTVSTVSYSILQTAMYILFQWLREVVLADDEEERHKGYGNLRQHCTKESIVKF